MMTIDSALVERLKVQGFCSGANPPGPIPANFGIGLISEFVKVCRIKKS
jgi:hypothetical protein